MSCGQQRPGGSYRFIGQGDTSALHPGPFHQIQQPSLFNGLGFRWQLGNNGQRTLVQCCPQLFVATFFMGGTELARVGFDQFINENSMFYDPTVEYGNNKANRITPITVDALSSFTGTSITAFDKVEFNLGGSSAIDNIDVSSCQTPIVNEFIDNEAQQIVANAQFDSSSSLQNTFVSQEKIEELEEKITTLEDEVREKNEDLSKKDSVLKEQLKVISDLVNMIKNAIFEPLARL